MCIQRTKDDSSRIIDYNKLLAYQEFSAMFSITLNVCDNKIVERAILVSGDWDPRFFVCGYSSIKRYHIL